MSTKSLNTPIGETSRDTASSIAVTLESSDRIATAANMAAVASNTNPRWKWYLIFFGLQLALFSSSLEYSIVSTALPKIGSDLDAMLISSWVVTSYIVTQNAFQPIWAKLSDIFGRKCILLVTLSLFLTCSALCGVSQSMTWLITARAFQGIGVAGVFPLMYIIVADIVPLDKRASYEGLIQACFTFATVCGPFVGGTLTDHVSWRGIFFVIIPLGLIGMIIIGLFLHLPVEKQDLRNKLKRIDYAGILMVMGATVLFMLAMSFISQGYPWESPLIVAPMVTATVLVALLIYVETKVAIEPLLPPRLFTNVPVLCFNIYNLSWGIAYTAFMYYVPTYFQVVHGDSSMMSGVRLIPLDVCSMIVAFAVGWYITLKGGYRLPLSGGMALYVICFGLFFLFDANTSWAEIQGIMVIGGVGTGGIVGSSAIALQAAVEERDIAVASGLLAYTFMLGGGLGAALAFALINLYLQNNLPRMIPPEYAERIFDYPGFIRDGLPSQYFDAAIEVYNDAYKRLWYLMVIFSGIAFVSSLFIKQFSLIRVDSDDTIHEEVNDRQSPNVSEPNKNPNRSPTSISGQYQSLATDQQLLRSY